MLVVRRLVIPAILVSTSALSLWRLRPPADDIDRFSTANAIEHDRFIASERHPVGAPHHQVVCDYLVNQFQKLGYNVQIQDARYGALPLRNILARKPGTVPGGKAVMLAAHYDSVRSGPGAADDGAAVAALLEVARIISDRSYPNDIIFLISDGEEMGLLGARAFVGGHPWAKDVGAVLNFEARGTSGPSIMFETSDHNAWLIDLYARHAPHPVCSSISYDLYKLMPNDTDFTIFRDDGHLQGLNFAFIGSYANYHTPNDDIDHLDRGSLRHHGLQALSLVEPLAKMDLAHPPVTGGSVYFDILSLGVVRYPAWLAPIFAVAVSVFAVVVLKIAVRRRAVKIKGLLWALAMLVVQLLVIPALAWVLQRSMRSLDLHRHADWAILIFVCFAAALAVLGFFWQRIAALELAAAGVILWTILSLASGFALRGGSYLATWPLLLAAAGLAAFVFQISDRIRLAILIFAAIFSALLLAPILYMAFLGMTLRLAWLLVVPVVAVMWLFPIQFRYPPRPAMVQ
jgi:hypothetical protein